MKMRSVVNTTQDCFQTKHQRPWQKG